MNDERLDVAARKLCALRGLHSDAEYYAVQRSADGLDVVIKTDTALNHAKREIELHLQVAEALNHAVYYRD